MLRQPNSLKIKRKLVIFITADTCILELMLQVDEEPSADYDHSSRSIIELEKNRFNQALFSIVLWKLCSTKRNLSTI